MERVFERYADMIPAFETFQACLHAPLPQHLRVNTLKIKTAHLLRALERKGVFLNKAINSHDTLFVAPDGLSPGKWLEYALGYIHPQALTSCLASLILSPRPGSYVLDMCASPGGKTSHLAQLMGGEGLIVANELQRRRHTPLLHTLARLGVMNAVLTSYPAQEFPFRGRFDFVMADVPCSGEGTYRHSQDPSRQRVQKGRSRLSETQKRIILRGFDLLRKGGQMLYATCTYNPEENESVVNHLLKERNAEMLTIESPLLSSPGLPGWNKETYAKDIQKAARFYPHVVDSVGFFMARIGRRE
jgi:NOL1/NOP2/sun family putative RNA methylase